MNIFDVNTKIKTYTYPIIKIVIGLVLILTILFRSKWLSINSHTANTIISILCFLVCAFTILSIYISIAEILELYERNKEQRLLKSLQQTMSIPLSEVIDSIIKNDIIEFLILSENGIVKIGSSSDNKYSSAVFTDKRYYIDNEEYQSQETFSLELTKLFSEQTVNVITVDGVIPN